MIRNNTSSESVAFLADVNGSVYKYAYRMVAMTGNFFQKNAPDCSRQARSVKDDALACVQISTDTAIEFGEKRFVVALC